MDPMRRIVVIGDGGWGTAMSMVLADLGREVAMWSCDAEYAELMRATRTNPRYLPGFDLKPPAIGAEARITTVFDTLVSVTDRMKQVTVAAWSRAEIAMGRA